MDVDVEGSQAALSDAVNARDHSNSVDQWVKFLTRCISTRLDPDTFESYVGLLYSKHPLPLPVIADVCLRPHPSNHESLDPRIPRYIQVLVQNGLIDTPSILNALYKYSTSHTQAQRIDQQQLGDSLVKEPLRWGSSYAAEEVIFYRLTKAVGLGLGIKSSSDAVQVCKIMAKWMTLFTSASAAFAQDVMGKLHSTQSRDEMEAARAAFVMFLLSVCENPTVLGALSRPFAKGLLPRLYMASATVH